MKEKRRTIPGKLKVCGIIALYVLLTTGWLTAAFAKPSIIFGGVNLAGAEFGDHNLPVDVMTPVTRLWTTC